MTTRPPLTDQERNQIRTLTRFLVFVLLAVALASVVVAILSGALGVPTAPLVTATPGT